MDRHNRTIERAVKAFLLVLVGLSLVIILSSWILWAWAALKPNVASVRRQVLFLDAACFAVALASLATWFGIHRHGLVQMLWIIPVALILSLVAVALGALWGSREFETSAIPGNLNYEFLARQNPAQYTTWAQQAAGTDVERWREVRYGFPETFLHVCQGLTTSGQYIMVDWFRLLFDWILAFAVSLVLAVGTGLCVHREAPPKGPAGT